MKLPVIDQTDLKNKRVFLRADIDIPLTGERSIADDTRLKDSWPTVEYLLNQGCTVLLAGHLGRPEGKEDVNLSSKPVAGWFKNKVNKDSNNEVAGVRLKEKIGGFSVTDKLIVLENLRFDSREENGDEGYAKELASLANVYVNEAFGADYENHASISGVPKFLPHYAGFRLAKEVEVLSGILEAPKRPLLVIVGGAKAETKIPVIAKMQEVADKIIVGGGVVIDLFPYARDHKVALDPEKIWALPLTADFKDVFAQAIASTVVDFLKAKTIIWNGPFGAIEEERYQLGTRVVADLILQNTKAYKVVGGGDTVGFINKLGLAGKFDWVCSGGGSMLKFLAGEKLPGVEALLL